MVASIAYHLQGAIKWVVIMMLFLTSCNIGGGKIGSTEQICQNLLTSGLLSICTPADHPTTQFFESTFPLTKVDLHYIETAMSGFEITFSKDYNGVDNCQAREYKINTSLSVEFILCRGVLKQIYYSDSWW